MARCDKIALRTLGLLHSTSLFNAFTVVSTADPDELSLNTGTFLEDGCTGPAGSASGNDGANLDANGGERRSPSGRPPRNGSSTCLPTNPSAPPRSRATNLRWKSTRGVHRSTCAVRLPRASEAINNMGVHKSRENGSRLMSIELHWGMLRRSRCVQIFLQIHSKTTTCLMFDALRAFVLGMVDEGSNLIRNRMRSQLFVEALVFLNCKRRIPALSCYLV